jgi:hypothetical protein
MTKEVNGSFANVSTSASLRLYKRLLLAMKNIPMKKTEKRKTNIITKFIPRRKFTIRRTNNIKKKNETIAKSIPEGNWSAMTFVL